MKRNVRAAVLAVVIFGLARTTAGAHGQGAPDAPVRLGSFATQLSPQDVTDLEAVLPGGAKPWLLFGGDCLFCEVSIAAYLPPTTEKPELRRGRILILRPPAGLIKGGMPPRTGSPAPSSWTFTGASSLYAQVAIPGRGFEQVQTVRDLDRPFGVLGDFDDAELLSIVGFVRSNSRYTGPITSVRRGPDGPVQVQILHGGGGWMLVQLRHEGQGWVVLQDRIVVE